MPAQIQELTNHYKLWNDQDEWYVEKATGVQVSNDLSDEWAHIWAGFRYKVNPGDPWTEKRIDALSWTWTTDSGTGWVKLIGDAYMAPGDTVHIHIEWILEDNDRLIEFKWRTENGWKDLAAVEQVIRNGKIDVNGAGPDCWYRFYKTDDTLLDGQLPADVSYNNITDGLKNRYKLIGNSKDIDWRWDETYDKNGTSTTSNVTVNVVDTNGVYGANGYVEHVYNIGPVSKDQYIETTQHWHDAETYYLVSLRNFEVSGTNRNYTGDSGNTLDSDKWFGMCYPTNEKSTHTINDANDKVAIKFTGVRSLDKVRVYITTSANTPTLKCAIQGHSGSAPDGSDIANLDGTVAVSDGAWNEVTFTGATLTEGTSYWLVCSIDGFGAGDSITFATALLATRDLTSTWFQAYDEYEAAWAGNSTAECLCALMYGQSDAGYYSIMQYGTDESMFTGSGAIGSAQWPTIKNDESTLYRTVFQIKPLDDSWIATKDTADEGLIDESSGSDTVWAGFFVKFAGWPDAKHLVDDGAGPEDATKNIFNTDVPTGGVGDAEWNGTNTNIPQVTTDSPPVTCGQWDQFEDRIENYNAATTTNWEDEGVGYNIGQDEWATWEFWFKVTDNFVVDDEPEVKYYNSAGGGQVELAGFRFSYLVVVAAGAPTGGFNGPLMGPLGGPI